MIQSSKPKKRILFVTIAIMICSVIISGCIETGSVTQSSGNAISGGMITEHTYLFGTDGFFTKKYDLTIFFFGQSKQYNDLSYSQLQAYIQMYSKPGSQQNTVPATQQTTIIPENIIPQQTATIVTQSVTQVIVTTSPTPLPIRYPA